MPQSLPFPIPVSALKPVSCGSVLWRSAGFLRATIIVKISLGLVHERTAWPTTPLELVLEDRRRDANPNASLVEACEVMPFMPNAGVILFAHACAPQGRPVPALSARLAVFREGSLIDKTVHVFGERAANASQHPRPFERVPLVYERTWGGPNSEDNPVGVPSGAASLPSICDATNPTRPAGFGPISRQWPQRKRLLGVTDSTRIDAPIADFPNGFDFRWFNPAPTDQQIEYLRGDEWIVLDGMHPTLPRVQSRLPQMRGTACVYFVGTNSVSHSQLVDLVADMLVIDAERLVASVIFRGSLPLDSLEVLPRLRVFADVELPGNPTRWPEGADVLRAPAPMPIAAATNDHLAPAIFTTQAAREDSAIRPALPFQPKPSSGSPTIPPFAAAPPQRPRLEISDDDPLMRTVAADEEQSAMRPAMPFLGSGGVPVVAPPRLQPPPRVELPPPAPYRRPKDDDDATRAIDLGELTAKRAAVTPFAASAPGKPAAASGAIPGAPWSGAAAAPPPVVRSGAAQPARTMAFSIEDPDTQGVVEPEIEVLPFAKAEFGAKNTAVESKPHAPELGASSRPALPNAPPLASPRFDPPAIVKPPAMVEPPARIQSPAVVSSGIVATQTSVPASTPTLPPVVPPFVQEKPAAFDIVEAPPPIARASAAVLPDEPSEPSVAPQSGVSAPPPVVEETGVRATIIERLRSKVPAPLHGLSVAGADLSGLDMRGANLSSHDLGGVKFCKTNLSGARLGGARLVDADLEGADLSEADLSGADLSRAILKSTSMTRANIDNANFSAVQGAGAIFDGAKGRATLFVRGQWLGASFRNIDVLGADFTGALLDGAIFERAVMPDAKLNDARGKGATFDGARIDQLHADGSTFVECTFCDVDAKDSGWENATVDASSFNDARMENAVFVRASCREAKFIDTKLRAANFGRAQGDAADFGGAFLESADFRQARFCDARFEGAKMPNVLAPRADFSRSNFERTDLSNGSLRAAQLGGANLAHACLDGADLRDADLKRSILFKASRTGAKLSGANTKDAIEHDPKE